MLRFACLLAVGVGLCLPATSGTALAGASAPHPMPAHPDLIRTLGPTRVAALQRAGLPEREGYEMMTRSLRRTHLAADKARTNGTGSCLFILWTFPDHTADTADHPRGDYEDMFFSIGTYPTGSMNDFYLEASHGTYQIGGVVSGWTTSSHTYASYANADGTQDYYTCKEMIRDVIAQLDPVVDFAQFDNDGPDGIPDSGDDDGSVDSIFFIHAGPGQEASGSTQDIWSHAWSFWDLTTNDGVDIGRYSVEPEELPSGDMSTMGVFAHEYGHVLGLPDLYDTDYSSSGIGEWGLMSGGSWNSRPGDLGGSCPAQMTAWSKAQLGWVTPVAITATTTDLVLPAAATHAVAYRVWRDGAAGSDEYFLIENRQNVGFDAGLVRRQVDYGLPLADGLLLYHVDDAMGSNTNDHHRLLDVEDASPWILNDGSARENLDGVIDYGVRRYVWSYNRGDNGDTWPGFSAVNGDSTDWLSPRDRDRFADDTTPGAEDYACAPTGVAITHIVLSGDDVVADVEINTPQISTPAVPASVVWDFEDGMQDLRGCNAVAHFDQTQAGTCGGPGGLWFGTTGWDYCGGAGYGNNWDDAVAVAALVGIDAAPQVILTHRYETESGYDFARLEVRAADVGAAWTTLGSFSGSANCRTDTWTIPPTVLEAGRVGATGNAKVELRMRLTSDGSYSPEDGNFCGVGWWVDQLEVTGTPTGVDELPGAMPTVAQLRPPVPNPFNPLTVLPYFVPTGARAVTLRVYDARGSAVRMLVSGPAAPGWQEARWDGRDDGGNRVASGLYFATLQVDGTQRTQKVALVK